MTQFVIRKIPAFLIILLMVNATSHIVSNARIHELEQYQWHLRPDDKVPAKTIPMLTHEYAEYFRGLLRGNLGTLRSQRPVSDVVLEAIPRSLILLGLAMTLSALLGVAFGVLSVNRRTRRTNSLALFVSLGGFAMPSFYLGIFIIALMIGLSLVRGKGVIFLPVIGYGLDEHLILPVLVLSARPTAEISRLTAELLADELSRNYIRTARAKGLPWRLVLMRHAFRNVVATVVVTMGNSLRYMVSSLIVVEWLFQWEGLGQLLLETIWKSDRAIEGVIFEPALAAATMTLVALAFLLTTLVTDLFAQMLDPRVRRYQHV